MPRMSKQEGAQPRAAAQGNDGPIDHTVLDRLLCDDQEAVGVVLRQFRASCPGDASALGVALSRNDSKGALRWAHRLKGACQMVGALSLADVCERIEAAVRAGDSRQVAGAVADIDREVQRITGYLDAWLSASP
jgi:HPt (histidine-containing phosphotransfer) domain-containing protein